MAILLIAVGYLFVRVGLGVIYRQVATRGYAKAMDERTWQLSPSSDSLVNSFALTSLRRVRLVAYLLLFVALMARGGGTNSFLGAVLFFLLLWGVIKAALGLDKVRVEGKQGPLRR